MGRKGVVSHQSPLMHAKKAFCGDTSKDTCQGFPMHSLTISTLLVFKLEIYKPQRLISQSFLLFLLERESSQKPINFLSV